MTHDRRTEMPGRRSNDVDRIARIETRLVQLMIWLGADPHNHNLSGGFVDNLLHEMREEFDAPAPDETFGPDSSDLSGAAPGTNWAKFDRPTYLRRGGVCAQCPHTASAGATSHAAS